MQNETQPHVIVVTINCLVRISYDVVVIMVIWPMMKYNIVVIVVIWPMMKNNL